MVYAIEFRNIFEGRASGLWTKKYTVSAKTPRAALTAAKRRYFGSPVPRHSVVEYPDGNIRATIVGMDLALFVYLIH